MKQLSKKVDKASRKNKHLTTNKISSRSKNFTVDVNKNNLRLETL